MKFIDLHKCIPAGFIRSVCVILAVGTSLATAESQTRRPNVLFLFADDIYTAFMPWLRAVRDHRHKLIECCVADGRHTRLFGLTADPWETNCVAGQVERQATLESPCALPRQERLRLNDGGSRFPSADQQREEFRQNYEAR